MERTAIETDSLLRDKILKAEAEFGSQSIELAGAFQCYANYLRANNLINDADTLAGKAQSIVISLGLPLSALSDEIPQISTKHQTKVEGTKVCPFCAEIIKLQALKCRYCGSILQEEIHTKPNHKPTCLADLSTNELLFFENEFNRRRKSTLIAYLLLVFLGLFGAHKFYIGKPIWGGAYIWMLIFSLTIIPGLVLGILLIKDLCITAVEVEAENEKLRKRLFAEVTGTAVIHERTPVANAVPSSKQTVASAGKSKTPWYMIRFSWKSPLTWLLMVVACVTPVVFVAFAKQLVGEVQHSEISYPVLKRLPAGWVYYQKKDHGDYLLVDENLGYREESSGPVGSQLGHEGASANDYPFNDKNTVSWTEAIDNGYLADECVKLEPTQVPTEWQECLLAASASHLNKE